jgi:hypothetical protein
VLAFAWKLVPTDVRDAFELRHPRIAGIIRIIVSLWPSLVDAGKAAQRQVIAGTPKAATPSPSAAKAKLPSVIVSSMLLALALAGCSGTQSPPSPFLTEARVIAHSVAVGYCALHTAATPMILAATAVYPPLTIPSHIADAFCASVAVVERDRDRAAHSVLPAGVPEYSVPEYSLDVDGFAVLTR